MALITTTRRYIFKSVHALHTGELRERRHGHEYGLEVTFSGCPVAVADREVETLVLPAVHGRELGGELEPSTGEVLVEWIHNRLSQSRLAPHLLAVALQETRKNRFVSSKTEARFV